MKLILLGTGQKIFDALSATRRRIVGYGEIFDEVHMVVFTNAGNNYSDEQLSKNVFLYPTNSKSRALFLFDYLKIVGKILAGKNKSEFVISAQDPFETGLVGLLAKLFYRLPLQIQLHTDFLNKYFITHSILNLIRFHLGMFILSFGDSVRCVSERAAQTVRAIANNVSVLPILIDSSSLSQGRDKVTSGNINILTVCRLEKEKDIPTLLEAFKKVLDKGVPSTLTIVGDGSARKDLELRTKSLGIEDRVNFVGWQNDLHKYYAQADIYISTSLYEGYGMSIVEAGYAKLPLVLSDAGVAGSIFKNGESAIVCLQGRVDSFAQALASLAMDEGLRQRLGASAEQEAKRHILSPTEYLDRYRQSVKQAQSFYRSGGIFKKNILLRYVVAGLTGAGTQIGLLYIFTDVVKVWYIYSSIIAFVSAIVVSFVLQKFWTFKDRATKHIHHQAVKYLITAISGLAVNTVLMYIFVDIIHLWYILAQIIIGAIIMVFNFLMYKFFVFKERHSNQ